jgi:hypothetical protein
MPPGGLGKITQRDPGQYTNLAYTASVGTHTREKNGRETGRWLPKPVILLRCAGRPKRGDSAAYVASLATFRRKNALSDTGRATLRATDVVFCGDLARVHSGARGEWTVPA